MSTFLNLVKAARIKQASVLDNISIEPANKTHGMVAGGVGGGLAGAGLGALTGGAAGLTSALMDDEDDGVVSTIKKTLKAALTGGAAGGVLGGVTGGVLGRGASGAVAGSVKDRTDTAAALMSMFAGKKMREKVIEPAFRDTADEIRKARVPLSKVISDEKPVIKDMTDAARADGADARIELKNAERIRDLNKTAASDIQGVWASLVKGADAVEAAPVEVTAQDSQSQRDADGLRKRHILLALKRAIQVGGVGALAGGMAAGGQEGGLSGGTGAVLGGLGGLVAGGAAGAAEGGVKRTFGIDPILQTVAIARRP